MFNQNVLDMLAEIYPTVYSFNVHEIGEIIGTQKDGTANGPNIDNINKSLEKCVPSVSFERDHSFARASLLLYSMKNGFNPYLMILGQFRASQPPLISLQ
ncbi:MAG: hypothetical protein E4H21_11415 [Thermodesulfobacteriales bacterium]|nr:MAG: hypothetical protein E4H21_11415 [Thermodesulfobacteriales bacterium]